MTKFIQKYEDIQEKSVEVLRIETEIGKFSSNMPGKRIQKHVLFVTL